MPTNKRPQASQQSIPTHLASHKGGPPSPSIKVPYEHRAHQLLIKWRAVDDSVRGVTKGMCALKEPLWWPVHQLSANRGDIDET
jgi:hypothetical protein